MSRGSSKRDSPIFFLEPGLKPVRLLFHQDIMRDCLNPIPLRSADALRHRLAVFWIVIALLCLPTGWVLAGAIDDGGPGMASVTLSRVASIVLLADIVMGDHLDLGDYADGQSERLFLAGQALSR